MPRKPAHDGMKPETEVMASMDGETDEFVIADISREDAWLTVRAGDAPVLTDWR